MTRFLFILTSFSALLFLLVSCAEDEAQQLVYSWPLPVTAEGEQKKEEAKKDEAARRLELEKLHHIPMDPYRISPSDIFDIKVYEHDSLTSMELVVTPDGFVSIPLIGPCQIGGMTLIDATNYLTMRISKFVRDPKVSLIPRHILGFTFTIGGRVTRPGRYPLSSGMKLQDAIADASGIQLGDYLGNAVEMADLKNSYIQRNGKMLPVDFEKALLYGDPLNNIPIRNGDYIYLPSSTNSAVYLLGEIRNPHYVTFKEDMTLLKAFAFCQGLTEAHGDWAYVTRSGARIKDPMVYKVNIKMIISGQAEDFPLAANDVIYVPKSGIEAYNYLVRQCMPTLELYNMLTGPFSNAAMYFGIK